MLGPMTAARSSPTAHIDHISDFRSPHRHPVARQTLSVEEAARILGIGRTSAYRAVARGELNHVRIGARILIPMAALERLLNGQAALTL